MRSRFSKALAMSSELGGYVHHIVNVAILDAQQELGFELSLDNHNRVYLDGYRMLEKDVNTIMRNVEAFRVSHNYRTGKRGGRFIRKSRIDNYFPFLSRDANAFWAQEIATFYGEDPPAIEDIPAFLQEYGADDAIFFFDNLKQDIDFVDSNYMGALGNDDAAEYYDNLPDDEQYKWDRNVSEIANYVYEAIAVLEELVKESRQDYADRFTRRSGRRILLRKVNTMMNRRRGRIMNRRNGRAPMRRRGIGRNRMRKYSTVVLDADDMRWLEFLGGKGPSNLVDWDKFDLLMLANAVESADGVIQAMWEPDFDEDWIDNAVGEYILELSDAEQGKLASSLDAISRAIGDAIRDKGYDSYDDFVNAAYGN